MTRPRLDEGSEREAFEAWAKQYGRIFLDRQPHGPYMHAFTQEAWVGWKARAALSTGRLGGEWLPIESAPKDGTQFLAFYAGKVEFFHWQESKLFPKDPVGWRDNFINVYREGTGPTHWMPLPLPPAPAAQSQGDSNA